MFDAAHIMVIIDIATSVWLIKFCLKAKKSCSLRNILRNFMEDIKISLRNIEGQSRKLRMIPSQDSSFIDLARFLVVFSLFYMDCPLDF